MKDLTIISSKTSNIKKAIKKYYYTILIIK